MKVNRQNLMLVPWMLFMILGGSGCATSTLWTSPGLECWNQPAENPDIKLFQTANKRDFVVVSNEYSERSDKVRTRAYLLKRNQKQIEKRHEPHFENPDIVHDLTVVPVYSSSFPGRDIAPSLFAVEGDECFTLYENASMGTYKLPDYNDGKGKIEKAALTPVAVTADLTIVGGVLGYFYLGGLCYSGASYR